MDEIISDVIADHQIMCSALWIFIFFLTLKSTWQQIFKHWGAFLSRPHLSQLSNNDFENVEEFH